MFPRQISGIAETNIRCFRDKYQVLLGQKSGIAETNIRCFRDGTKESQTEAFARITEKLGLSERVDVLFTPVTRL